MFERSTREFFSNRSTFITMPSESDHISIMALKVLNIYDFIFEFSGKLNFYLKTRIERPRFEILDSRTGFKRRRVFSCPPLKTKTVHSECTRKVSKRQLNIINSHLFIRLLYSLLHSCFVDKIEFMKDESYA